MRKSLNRNKLYFCIVLLLFLGMGVGYALIGSNLGVSNSITVLGYESKVLYDYMKVNAAPDNTSSTYVTSENGISFSAVGSTTNGQGIYMVGSTADDTYPIYYFRGPITNNNLKFAGFCWKMVRTTNTGGVKIIYNGVPASDGSCSNTGEATETGKSMYNAWTYPSVADVGFMYGTRLETTSTNSMSSTKYKYGNDVTYSDGIYTLQNVHSSTSAYWLIYTQLKNGYHYTCLSTSTSCSTVYYVYDFASTTTVHHAVLTGGMLLNPYLETGTTGSTNTTASTIKTYLDSWYTSNLASYSSYLEDTGWCNDRSIYEYGVWDKDTSSGDLHFGGYQRNFITYKPIPTCPNSNDLFSVNTANGNGKLTNPIGLITADEIILASGGTDSYMNTGSSYWTMTPSYYGNTSTGARNYCFSSGILEALSNNNSEKGVRPVVSLKPGTEYSSGDGSPETPYVVE